MDSRELRRMSRAFWHRHRPVWAYIRENEPGFWEDAWDLLQEAQAARWTDRGAVVRDWPESSDAATGTERAAQDAAVQAVEAGAEVAQQGCWNCHSLLHSYSECRQPRRWNFCFGCGTRNVTVRTCPSCGPNYRRTRPYRDPWAPRDGGATERDEGWPWEERAPR